jgi:hypothetical protein
MTWLDTTSINGKHLNISFFYCSYLTCSSQDDKRMCDETLGNKAGNSDTEALNNSIEMEIIFKLKSIQSIKKMNIVFFV